MKLKLKSNVQLTDLQPQMIIALLVVMGVYKESGLSEVMVTSANDSKHGVGSRHYRGQALDFRTHDIGTLQIPKDTAEDIKRLRANKLERIRQNISNSLIGYDVILEDVNQPNEHLHVEYDPKYPTPPINKVA